MKWKEHEYRGEPGKEGAFYPIFLRVIKYSVRGIHVPPQVPENVARSSQGELDGRVE